MMEMNPAMQLASDYPGIDKYTGFLNGQSGYG